MRKGSGTGSHPRGTTATSLCLQADCGTSVGGASSYGAFPGAYVGRLRVLVVPCDVDAGILGAELLHRALGCWAGPLIPLTSGSKPTDFVPHVLKGHRLSRLTFSYALLKVPMDDLDNVHLLISLLTP